MSTNASRQRGARLRGAHRSLLAAVLLIVGAACSGPTVETQVGIREIGSDVIYGDQGRPDPPPPPPAADPSPNFPGFLNPPTPRTVVAAPPPTPAPTTTTTTEPEPECPTADPFATPPVFAPIRVETPPREGVYPFRQEGVEVVDGETVAELPPQSERLVSAVDEVVPGVVRFDVAVAEFETTTITTFEVDQRGVDDGVYIVQVRSEDEFGTQSFTPSVRVELLPLPVTQGARWTSVGADPLHGTAMILHGTVVGRDIVDVCGRVADAWTVEIGADADGEPSRIITSDGSFVLEATYSVDTLHGGMVTADDVRITAADDPDTRQESRATVNSLDPSPLPEPEGDA